MMWLPFSWGGGLINKRQKEVLEYQLEEEKKVIQELEKRYNQALKDINEKVKLFQADIDLLDEALSQDGLDDATRALLQSQKRSKVYQQTYQRALKSQISGILDKMQGDNFTIIDKYLNGCYETGYIGTLYDIAGQGIPIIAPIDQAAVVKAVQLDSKISNGLYSALGMDTKRLKKNITQEISRGIASSLSYSDISRNLKNTSGVPLYNAKRIVRTESHRIQQQSAEDSRRIAKNKGADIVRMWDASLDGRTRPSHARVDGEVRELDEKFSNGLMFPGDPSGGAAEVINCRCTSNTRARWALDEEELQTLKDRAEFFGLDKTENFEDYRKKYLSAVENSENGAIMKLPDIQIGKSVGAKAKNYNISLPNREIVQLTEGTRVTNVRVIAGKGRNREIDEMPILLIRYPGTSEVEWQKAKGIGYIDYNGESYKAELHWYQEPSVGRVEWKVKPDADGNWFIEDD